MHAVHGLVGSGFLTGVMELAIGADVQVILTGLQAAHAEQHAGKAEHIHTALVVVVLTGEQALDGIGAVQGLGIGDHAAQQGNQFIGVPRSVLTHEQVGALGAVVAIVRLVDVLTQHVDGLNAGHGALGVHAGNDVAGSVVILGDGLNRGAFQVDHVDGHLAGGRHVGSVDGGSGGVRGVGSESALAVQQLLHPVNAHQRHTLDVVDAVKVGGEVDGAGGGVAGDGQTNDGVLLQISLEVGHLVQILGNVHDGASLAVLGQLGSGTGDHVDLIEALLPVLELVAGGVALVLVLKDNIQHLLDLDPGGLEVAGVVGDAVGQGDAFARDGRVEEQAGLGVVVAGSHAQNDGLLGDSGADEQGGHHGQRHQQGNDTLHSWFLLYILPDDAGKVRSSGNTPSVIRQAGCELPREGAFELRSTATPQPGR